MLNHLTSLKPIASSKVAASMHLHLQPHHPPPPPPPMAKSSVIEIHELSSPTPERKSQTRSSRTSTPEKNTSSPITSNLVIDKTLSSAANLVKLLPSGTVLAFQALSPSFSNKGSCYPSNKYLTSSLIIICSLSCIFFSLTDSLKGRDGKIYFGIATFKGFYVFNYDGSDKESSSVFGDLSRFRLRWLDYVHAFFSIVVFLALTFGDADIQRCLFPDAGLDAKELLVNLPLGAAVLSSLVFMTFPTSRKGIGYSDSAPHEQLA